MIPSTVVDVIVVLLATVAGSAGLVIARRVIPHEQVRGHNEAAGFISATLGVIYAVLMAFVVIAVWETYAKAEDVVAAEAASLVSLYRDANAFPEPQRQELQEALRRYARAVIDDEWATMRQGKPSPKTEQALSSILRLYRELRPQSPWEVAIGAESFRQLNEVSKQRTQRLEASRGALPQVFWPVLVGGGILTVFFTYFFHTENLRAHAVMCGLLGGLVAATLFLVVAFDRPFVGDTSISPEAFTFALELFEMEGPAAAR